MYSTNRAMDSVQRKTASARYLNRTVRRPTPHAHGTQSTRTHPDKNGISKNPHDTYPQSDHKRAPRITWCSFQMKPLCEYQIIIKGISIGMSLASGTIKHVAQLLAILEASSPIAVGARCPLFGQVCQSTLEAFH